MVDLPGIGSSYLDIVVRTAVIFVVVVVGLRLGGKREVGQLGIIDLVALLLLSNAVQNAMVGTDTSLLGGIIAAVVILVSARTWDMLVRRFPQLRRAVLGEPRVLISHGDIWQRALREESISLDELNEAIREHGLDNTREVKMAVLEVDGSISIIPEPEAADKYQAGGGPEGAGRRAGRIRRHDDRHAQAPDDGSSSTDALSEEKQP
jgi:uncharacterized membrane protein YcaP (DUF421 family)